MATKQITDPRQLQMEYDALSIRECEALLFTEATGKYIVECNKKNAEAVLEKIKRYNPDPKKILNIVLIGESGSGKSSTGNLILGEEKFKVSSGATACSSTIDYHEREVNGVLVRVVDTPWLFHSEVTIDHIATEILKVGIVLPEGIHLLVFVKHPQQLHLTKDEIKAIDIIKAISSEVLLGKCVFLFTHANTMLNMENLKVNGSESRLDEYLKGLLTSDWQSRTKDTSDAEKNNDVDFRVLAVENVADSPYEKKIQQQCLISNFLSIALSHAFTHKYAENVKKAIQDKCCNRPFDLGCREVFRDLMSKANADMIKIKGPYGGKPIFSEGEASKGDSSVLNAVSAVITDDQFLNPVKELVRKCSGTAFRGILSNLSSSVKCFWKNTSIEG